MATKKTPLLFRFLKKIEKAQVLLEEIKQDLFKYQKDLEESIKRGEEDIRAGRITTCKTPADLDRFFNEL